MESTYHSDETILERENRILKQKLKEALQENSPKSNKQAAFVLNKDQVDFWFGLPRAEKGRLMRKFLYSLMETSITDQS